MRQLTLFIMLSAFFAFFGCKTTKIDPNNYTDWQIRFGDGGGFSGKITEYALFASGDIYSVQGESLQHLTKVPRKTAKQFQSNLQSIGFDELSFKKPGNIYYWIETKDQSRTRKITWGEEEELRHPGAHAIRKSFLSIIKKKTSK